MADNYEHHNSSCKPSWAEWMDENDPIEKPTEDRVSEVEYVVKLPIDAEYDAFWHYAKQNADERNAKLDAIEHEEEVPMPDNTVREGVNFFDVLAAEQPRRHKYKTITLVDGSKRELLPNDCMWRESATQGMLKGYFLGDKRNIITRAQYDDWKKGRSGTPFKPTVGSIITITVYDKKTYLTKDVKAVVAKSPNNDPIVHLVETYKSTNALGFKSKIKFLESWLDATLIYKRIPLYQPREKWIVLASEKTHDLIETYVENRLKCKYCADMRTAIEFLLIDDGPSSIAVIPTKDLIYRISLRWLVASAVGAKGLRDNTTYNDYSANPSFQLEDEDRLYGYHTITLVLSELVTGNLYATSNLAQYMLYSLVMHQVSSNGESITLEMPEGREENRARLTPVIDVLSRVLFNIVNNNTV